MSRYVQKAKEEFWGRVGLLWGVLTGSLWYVSTMLWYWVKVSLLFEIAMVCSIFVVPSVFFVETIKALIRRQDVSVPRDHAMLRSFVACYVAWVSLFRRNGPCDQPEPCDPVGVEREVLEALAPVPRT